MSVPIQEALTYPENWPDGLKSLSGDMVSLELSTDDLRCLGSQSALFRQGYGDFRQPGFSGALMTRLADALAQFPQGIMPRIGHCSWKGSSVANTPARSLSELMLILTGDDPRVARSLMAHAIFGDPAYLHLRGWQDIPAWSEFRCFIREGRVIGVSQYRWAETFPEIARLETAIRATLRGFFRTALDELHLRTVVLDLWLEEDPDAPHGLAAHLIELNPFDGRTDPCLYSWNRGGDFDGGFRYTRPQRYPA